MIVGKYVPETVAISDVLKMNNQVNQSSGVFSMTVTRVTAGSGAVAMVDALWVDKETVRYGERGNSASW